MFFFLFTFVSPSVSGLKYSRLFRNQALTEMVFVRLPPLKIAAGGGGGGGGLIIRCRSVSLYMGL